MSRRAKSSRPAARGRSWSQRIGDHARDAVRRARWILWVTASVVVIVALFGAAVGVERLQQEAVRARLADAPGAGVEFVDLPVALRRYAADDLYDSVNEELGRSWIEDAACRRIAERLRKVGWIERVKFVRREPDARFLVGCEYRVPVAVVHHGGSNFLIDRQGVRLPGVYGNSSTAPMIERVVHPPPLAGEVWPGEDVQAGLAMLRVLAPEPFVDQIAAINVGNLGGRVDRTASHIELATDREDGRIRWGSVPGSEVEENGVEQKLALLRSNYRDTGRADAHHPVIDVSTFPDRFAVPDR